MGKNRKIEIIKTAEKRFVKHGLNKTTLDEIARDLRLGKSTIYHYFNSKEELYNETIKNEIKEYLDEINSLLKSENGGIIHLIKQYLQNKVSLKAKFPLVFKVFQYIFSEKANALETEIFNEFLIKEENRINQFLNACIKEDRQIKLQENTGKRLVSISNYLLIFNEINKMKKLENNEELLINEIDIFVSFLFPNI